MKDDIGNDAAPGSKFVYLDVEYFAARAPTQSCVGCAFDHVNCDFTPNGCGSQHTFWLTKQDYITHRLTT